MSDVPWLFHQTGVGVGVLRWKLCVSCEGGGPPPPLPAYLMLLGGCREGGNGHKVTTEGLQLYKVPTKGLLAGFRVSV